MAGITNVQYLYQKNLQSEQRLQAGYYRDLINHYGIPCIYFKSNQDFFASPSGEIIDYTYGESPMSKYTVSGAFNVFMNVQEDNPFLRKFGMETSTNAEVYFLQQDFTETFRDLIGTPTTTIFNNITISGNINNLSGTVSGTIIDTGTELSGWTSGSISLPATGNLFTDANFTFARTPLKYNADLYKSGEYDNRVCDGTLSGTLNAITDLSGNGVCSGVISGQLSYFTTPMLSAGPNWGIAPVVGDFYRLIEFDQNVQNFEEYEISDVQDKSLVPGAGGLNPLLRRYLWKCNVVRRDPSHEIIIGNLQKEKFTPELTVENGWHETVSNKIFDYSSQTPDTNVDNMLNANSVYGNY